MKDWRCWILPIVGAALGVAACAPAAVPSGRQESGGAQVAQGPSSRALVMVTRVEMKSLAPKVALTGQFGAGGSARRLFNANLTVNDERDAPHPELAEALPQLHTDTWRVLPDGRMETIYRLRSGLTWHDGSPLSADDFIFAWRAYTDPNPDVSGVFTPLPQRFMEEVAALDPSTILIRWRQSYPEAGILGATFAPLPRHILEEIYGRGQADAFVNHPWWSTEYIGLGPYRVARWEPGASIEGAAFGRYALGQPKIQRVRILFISDPNTAIANLLSGEAHVVVDQTIRFAQGVLLKREWGPRDGGVVLLSPTQLRYIQVQYRPDVVNPRAIQDLRVRKALLHAIDRKALADALLEGEGRPADTMLSPQVDFFASVDGAIAKYAYDLRRSEQLMAEAGFAKGRDGIFVGAAGQRFSPELRTNAGGLEEQELAIVADAWHQAGVDVRPLVVAAAQAQDGQFVATFPAFSAATTGGVAGEERLFKKLATIAIPSAENRWTGSALGGYSNPEYDRPYNVFNTSLDRAERTQAVVDMMKLASEELPLLTLYYNFEVDAHVAALRGPREGLSTTWNVHQWELR